MLAKAKDALILSIELFNRPNDQCRVSGTLILLDHSFEMLLKAGILQRGGKIREKNAKETIGFDVCVRRSLSDASIKFLQEEQALVLQTLNGLRDAAQHHLLDISESQLYLHIQSGVTLFRDLLKDVFGEELVDHLPARVLPISTTPPTDLATLFETEIREIKKLLKPGKRRRLEAMAKLRPLAILDSTIQGEKNQPSEPELRRVGNEIIKGRNWTDIFSGVSSIELTASGSGPSLSLRLTKKEGIPIKLVSEGTPGASVVAVKRVDELGFYSMGAKQLAEKVGLTMPKTVAVVDYLRLRDDDECYKEIKIGKSVHKRYSPKAIERVKQAVAEKGIEAIWDEQKKCS